MKTHPTLQDQLDEARAERDASKLDLALRAAYHYACRGRSVSTEDHRYGEVLEIDPNFYD